MPPRPGELDLAGFIRNQLRDIAAGCGGALPLPGSGQTWQRFAALADWSAQDLSLGRLAEGHADALAILAEAGSSPTDPGCTYGVWAARSGSGGTVARRADDGWRLAGEKPFCSGATMLDRALVTAETSDGYRLFDISVKENVIGLQQPAWVAVGMADSDSETAVFGGPPVPTRNEVGGPGFYLDRPGFWFGGTGVAGCWFGGARGLLGHALSWLGGEASDLVAAEIGQAVALVEAMQRVLAKAADEIDADPFDEERGARRRALVVRHSIHHASLEVLSHVAAAAGARPLCHDREQARRAADLYVYLAQYHGPHDAAALGRIALGDTSWS
jgi:hypothetical protein